VGDTPELSIGIDAATGVVACASIGVRNETFETVGETLLGDDLATAPSVVLSVRSQRTKSGGVHVLRELIVNAASPMATLPLQPYHVSVADIFEPDMQLGGITWTAAISANASVPEGSPWRTKICTQLQFPAPFADAFWVPRAGLPRTSHSNADWEDVLALELASAPPRLLQFGEGFLSGADGAGADEITPLPLVLHVSQRQGVALAVVHSLNDTTFGATMAVSANGSRWSRLFNRLGGGGTHSAVDITFTSHLVPVQGESHNMGGVRAALGFIADAYSPTFEPHEAAAAAVSEFGLGMYSCANAADHNLTALHQVGGNVVWDASFWWPYQGMFLPPLSVINATPPSGKNNLTWLSNLGGGEQTACGPMFTHGQRVALADVHAAGTAASAAGLAQLSYFNLDFFGQTPAYPSPPSSSLPPATLDDWHNSTLWLARHLRASSCAPPYGTCSTRDWQGSIAMDPGDATWANFLEEQAETKVAALGEAFRGIVIDEPHVQEWVWGRTEAGGGGAGWCGRPCASLLGGWLSTAARVAARVHSAPVQGGGGGVVLTNQIHTLRPELLRAADGVFTEAHPAQSNAPRYVNAIGLLTMRCVGIVWTESADEVAGAGGQGTAGQAEMDAFFHQRLYMGVFPMAPALGNDHAIGDDCSSAVRGTYVDHAHMLRQLRGAQWLLRPDALRVQLAANSTGDAVVVGNIFQTAAQGNGTPLELVIVAIAKTRSGGSNSSAGAVSVTLSFLLPRAARLGSAGCMLTHAGRPWTAVAPRQASSGRWELLVPELLRSCAMLRCCLQKTPPSPPVPPLPPSPPPVPVVAVSVTDKVVLHTVSDGMLSYTLDTAMLSGGQLERLVTDPLVAARAAHLAPFYLRLGGTRGDFVQFTGSPSAPAPVVPELPNLPPAPFLRGNITARQLSVLTDFARAVSARLIIGLNGLLRVGAVQSGAWDSTNARALFAQDAATGTSVSSDGNMSGGGVWGYELGNEPMLWQANRWARNITAAQHAGDWAELRLAIAAVYATTPPAARPRAIGPDVFVPCLPNQQQKLECDVQYLRDFLSAKPDLDVLTVRAHARVRARSTDCCPLTTDH
jgi:hypothetical protein